MLSPSLAENLAAALRWGHAPSRFGLAVCDLASVWCICKRDMLRWGHPPVSPQGASHQRGALSREGAGAHEHPGAARRSSPLHHGAKPWAAAFLLGTEHLELPVLDDGYLFAHLKTLVRGGVAAGGHLGRSFSGSC